MAPEDQTDLQGTEEAKSRIGTPSKVQTREEELAEASADISRRDGDFLLYGKVAIAIQSTYADDSPGYYLRGAGIKNFVFLVSSTFIYSVFLLSPQYWLKEWTESGSRSTVFYIVGYILLLLIAWIATNGTKW